MSAIDRAFIATNFEEVDLEDNPDKSLCRYEFYEIIVRIAVEKYVESGVWKTAGSALNMLLEKNIYKNWAFVIPWQEWREDQLWTISIDDLYKSNMESLRRLYNVILEI